MNKVIYVFNKELAENLTFAGFKMHTSGEDSEGKSYYVFFLEESKMPSFFNNFSQAEDFAFSNKIFF